MGEKLNLEEAKALAQWSSFGQAGRPSSIRVRASAWKTKPFKKAERAPWRVPVPADKLGTLLHGFRPEEMEDKWFVYADGPDAAGRAKLHMHRSWTGFKVAELDIRTVGNRKHETEDWKAEITAIAFETDGDRIGDQSEKSAKYQAL
jgi:hypothetical protein